jgi:hypothetical protein
MTIGTSDYPPAVLAGAMKGTGKLGNGGTGNGGTRELESWRAGELEN